MPQIDTDLLPSCPTQLAEIISNAKIPGLADEPVCHEAASMISQLAEEYRGSLIESGLWLLFGELDRSHDISQNIGSAEGSFWHGIMHRREGDFGNSKYWFRRVGEGHPVHQALAAKIADSNLDADFESFGLDSSDTIAFGLVDACQTAISRKKGLIPDLEQICWWEWQMLLEHCF